MKKKSTILKFIIGIVLVFYVTVVGSGIHHSNNDEFDKQTVSAGNTETLSDGQFEEPTIEDYATELDSAVASTTEESPAPTEASTEEIIDEAYLQLQEMTLEEKVGQLFIIRPEALHPYATFLAVNDIEKYGVTGLDAEMLETLRKYQVGGVIYFTKNVIYPEQLENFTRDMQANVKIPLFVGIDEEGGAVVRIAAVDAFKAPKYDTMEKIGNTGITENARNASEGIGSYLRDYGINLNFAPVADVNTNPQNRVIGNRSFGSDPVLVADMITASIEGFHSQDIMTTAKHFPGHGDTTNDTHAGTVHMYKTWEELKQCELIPFEAAIEADTDFIMVAHISLPNVTSDGLPASLSYELITGKLREEMGYDGLIITDSLSMGAIINNYEAGEAAVMAVQAGADVLLMPADFIEAYDAVLAAVTSGEIDEARIDESVLRILRAKQNL